jgi:mevalonate kinase
VITLFVKSYKKPFELAQVALGLLSERMTLPLLSGMNIKVESNLPIGCGMGSSAATILSIMQALSHFLGLQITEEALFKAALEVENLQHGRSSGLDLRLALNGGCLYVEKDVIEPRNLPPLPFYLVQTGQPQSSTGQCVSRVEPFFKQEALLNDFQSVTQAMDHALQHNEFNSLQEVIKINHALLNQIGVVPDKVQAFVREVEALGGAAKVCGAGAVSGEAAGTLWLLHENPASLSPLLIRYQYTDMCVHGVATGVYAA